jgi:hypothetical protein
MALGFTESNGGGGDFLPIIKYSAQSGDFVRQERQQQPDGTWSKSDAEMPYPISIAMDMEGIEVGWMSFANGPDFQMVKLGDAKPQRPSADHNEGFRIRVYNKDLAVREWSSSSKVVKQSMNKLHDMTERVTINTPKGELVFKAPKFAPITQWIDADAFAAASPAAAPAQAEPAPQPPAASGSDLF